MNAKSGQRQNRIVITIGPKTVRDDRLSNYLVRKYHALAVEVGQFAREVARSADDSTLLPVLHGADRQESVAYDSEYLIHQLIAAFTQLHALATDIIVIVGIKTAAELAVLQKQFEDDVLVVLDEAQHQAGLATNNTAVTDYHAPDLLKTAVAVDVILTATDSAQAYDRQIDEKIVPYLLPSRAKSNQQ